MKNLTTFKEFLNESSNKAAMVAFNDVMELDSPDMEVFLGLLAEYFKRNEEGLTNMDAKKIAEHLYAAEALLKKRSGN